MGDHYARAGVWDPSKIRIYPFLPAFLNPPKVEKTVQQQHETIQRRIPRGHSGVRKSFNRRTEVYVTDPRGTGKAINTEDRATVDSSLGELRKRSKDPNGLSKATLDHLRRYSRPPVYGK